MSREKAREILYDNMSDNTTKHINDISYLEDWIIDAMVEYHKKQVKNNDSLHSVSKRTICKECQKKVVIDMKKFNINDSICIQITDEGWKHLKETVGDDYIKHCIDTEHYRVKIDGEIWHKLQAHQVFDLLPVNFGGRPTYNTNVLIDEKDLK